MVDNDEELDNNLETKAHSDYKIPNLKDSMVKHQLSGMFQNWFLDYASYVILDRAVPHLYDGLKPVQRRILHSMKRMDDGRYNKVANIVGHTMQFHPHGDASIGNALVQLGQKDFLLDCQGNWGNVLTGDAAAAPRYIEARLSKFALEVVFNTKTTEWKLSYDGRNEEPVALPVKFPLLLAQGTEGIGVGLSTKILPHNFNELIEASIAYLKRESFDLYPDFVTGGSIDVSRYNDGKRDGKLKIRAKISKIDNKTLCISEIPYGTTTESVIDSILRATEKGKLQIKKVDDNTSASVEILVYLLPGKSSDKTIDALYAFTDCQISVSPNCCVIYEDKPHFISVSDVLRFSADNTMNLLKEELLIRKAELQESIFILSLEKIFIEERIYKDKEFEESKNVKSAIKHIDNRLDPFKANLSRTVEEEDIVKLLQIKMSRILGFNSDKVVGDIKALHAELEDIKNNLAHIVEFTIKWFEHLKEKYGSEYPRKTEIRSFDNIEVSKVVEANEKLYINREEGFIGIGLKRDEYVCNCSDIDDIAVFYKDGTFKVIKVAEKIYVGKNVLHLSIFNKNDKRTIYNMVYKNGKDSISYIKRFALGGLTRDKDYDLTQGTKGTKVLYFSENPNGEAEVLKVFLKPKPRLKNLTFERDFSEISIKGRSSMGNIFTKNDIHRIVLKQKGVSTLGGRKVWFDHDVLRLNYDERGSLLGEFCHEDLILVISKRGTFETSNFDSSNHYPDDILRIEKFDPDKIWTAVLYNAEQKNPYIKRFKLEPSAKEISFIGEHPDSQLILLTDTHFPILEINLEGAIDNTEPLVIDADEYIGLKSYKAKGKRVATAMINTVKELKPLRVPEEQDDSVPETNDEDSDKNSDLSQKTLGDDGQFSLF